MHSEPNLKGWVLGEAIRTNLVNLPSYSSVKLAAPSVAIESNSVHQPVLRRPHGRS